MASCLAPEQLKLAWLAFWRAGRALANDQRREITAWSGSAALALAFGIGAVNARSLPNIGADARSRAEQRSHVVTV